ncbi:PDR/VanB family oxidoreductase [Paraburkholderia sp. MM5384-R2]|uniref:PDR/VanB family oxidoreductase n=1 Tax=Paraburkholderia sp. MM5384-R2 TaxID=2723097 RepID=UPI0016220B15|nr:PDR/VanB family oxidoreductase [Paraburkholderia sp. MM5384-R2]MBB5498714.1 vanillate O-demethylase ferredoxin subunit [Paraburkholderia sp. MM5384-R2]
MSDGNITVRVVKKLMEADGIASFELAPASDDRLPPFSAGSHIDVHLPNNMVRQYSLCNSPAENHRYLIAVLRDPKTRGGSSCMHDAVNEGQVLEISKPKNLFELKRDAKKTILIAGGIGVTPILCMAHRLAIVGAEFEMHYASRSLSRTAFVDQINASSFSSRVQLHLDDGPNDQQFNAERVLGRPESSTHAYVCGPGGFIEHVLGTAKKLGWAEENLHREYFAAAVPTANQSTGTFEVEIASTGKVFEIPVEKSVVQVLAEHGIDIPVSCEQGVCGTCVTRVLDGDPDHRDMILTEAEHRQKDRFTPCCSRSKSARLILDL